MRLQLRRGPRRRSGRGRRFGLQGAWLSLCLCGLAAQAQAQDPQAPVEEAPGAQAPTVDAPSDDAGTNDAATDDAQADDAPADEAQADEAPAGDAQADDAQADETQPDDAQPGAAQVGGANTDGAPAVATPGDTGAAPGDAPPRAPAQEGPLFAEPDSPTVSPDAPIGTLPPLEEGDGPAVGPKGSGGALPEGGVTDDVGPGWQSALEGRLGYFWENSTRIIMPEAEVRTQSPGGYRVSAGYLVDIITSASIAFTGGGEDALHTERRHQPAVGLGKEFSVGEDTQLDVDLHARMSDESDYRSLPFASANFALSIDQRNTVIKWGGSFIRDKIRANNDPDFRGSLKGVSATAGLEQVLNRRTVLTLGYQLGSLWGYLGNPYRFTQMENAPIREDPPSTRHRHGLSVRLQHLLPGTDTAVHLMWKGYTDSWGVLAHAPEGRIYQLLGPTMVRLRYRYYRQTRADFQRDAYPRDWADGLTADPKLARFASHMYGMRLDLFMRFLDGTPLDFAEGSSIWLNLDFLDTGISFGEAWVGSAGGILPF